MRSDDRNREAIESLDRREPDGEEPTRLPPPATGPPWRSPERESGFPDDAGARDAIGNPIRDGDGVAITLYGRSAEYEQDMLDRGLCLGARGAVMALDPGGVIPLVFFPVTAEGRSLTAFVRPEDLVVVDPAPS